jgi:hypothetical protein
MAPSCRRGPTAVNGLVVVFRMVSFRVREVHSAHRCGAYVVQGHSMCRVLQVHHTELTDQPRSAYSWASGQHVGGTTTQPRSVCTRSPTKWFGNLSRRSSATEMFYRWPPTPLAAARTPSCVAASGRILRTPSCSPDPKTTGLVILIGNCRWLHLQRRQKAFQR